MILVTGASGLVGSHILLDLLKSGLQVKAIKRKNSDLSQLHAIFKAYVSKPEELLNNICWIDADVLDLHDLNAAFENVDQVFHCAAMVSYNPADKEKILEANIDGTANIVNLSLQYKIKKLCYISSIASLGISENDELITEETYWEPNNSSSTYSVSKFYAEMEVWRGIAEGLNAIIVNPSIILGYGNTSSTSIFRLIQHGFSYYTKGITGFVDVKDVSQLSIKLMNSDISGERFILSSENISWQEIFNLIADNFKVKRPNKYANSFLSGLAWRLEAVKSFFSRKSPSITRETARSAHKILLYSNAKIATKFDYKFKPVKSSIEEICQKLKEL